jgi:hypothetical protein
MRVMRVVGVVGLLGLIAGLGWWIFRLSPSFIGGTSATGIRLTILFDGGFLYSLNRKDQVDVGTVDKGNHPLKVKQITGTGISGELPLNDTIVSLLPNGEKPLPIKPGIPKYIPLGTQCADSDRTPANRNNLWFLPNLVEAASAMETTIKYNGGDKLPYQGNIELMGGGALYVLKLGGCVELKKADTTQVSKKSMVSGEQGMAYSWDIPDATMLVLRVARGGGGHTDYTLKADNNDELVLWVSSTFTLGNVNTMPGNPIAHYKHFNAAYNGVAAEKQANLIFDKQYFTSPGIDCPPGGDIVP